ncbi:hypothetical protein [Pseudacidovorax intermedius]|uniref:Uncharacterized protein n=1 Tax=Pseudacidovorax intermedius TaxID=433924 RepID=A0A147GPF5_9BURK|nr:hypothetical protein [Pseudacidovorax intermedius]KTT15848.1 hypothetical protein NS331_19505 [Pseudacidovorax intermedius]
MTTTIRTLAAMAVDAQTRMQRLAIAERGGEYFDLGAVAHMRNAQRARLDVCAEHLAALPAANDAAMPALEPA